MTQTTSNPVSTRVSRASALRTTLRPGAYLKQTTASSRLRESAGARSSPLASGSPRSTFDCGALLFRADPRDRLTPGYPAAQGVRAGGLAGYDSATLAAVNLLALVPSASIT